ncbi:MAG TPA: flavin reductase [Rhizomicrobium sp.]|jgi:flavin reductase (DIM6/NTAB) family NADH-FMN oxidoreductase RutF
MSLKSVARRVLGPLPQWASVAIIPPQRAISVSLEWSGRAVDVTENHTVASLKPLTLAIALGESIGDIATATLAYHDNRSGRNIGRLIIRRAAAKSIAQITIGLFEVVGSNHDCLSWPESRWNAWFQARAIRTNKNPHNFLMTPASLQQLMTFYIQPRPVVLVSVSEPTHSNIFPMDLIGPLGPSCFTLALRNTSISVPVMAAGGRVAISGIGAEHKDAVYRLGGHHKKEFADWDTLPFPTLRTRMFEIPAIASALQIRELAVDHHETIGSHMFFVCRIVSDHQMATGPQLHHTAGFHQEFRRRRGDPFPSA